MSNNPGNPELEVEKNPVILILRLKDRIEAACEADNLFQHAQEKTDQKSIDKLHAVHKAKIQVIGSIIALANWDSYWKQDIRENVFGNLPSALCKLLNSPVLGKFSSIRNEAKFAEYAQHGTPFDELPIGHIPSEVEKIIKEALQFIRFYGPDLKVYSHELIKLAEEYQPSVKQREDRVKTRLGDEDKTFIYTDKLERNKHLYFICKAGEFKKAINYTKTDTQFARDLLGYKFIKYPLLEIRDPKTKKPKRKYAIKRAIANDDALRLIKKIEEKRIARNTLNDLTPN